MPTLDWLNRASAFTTAAKVPYRLLEQVSAHTSHAENTTNSIATQAINTPARGKNSTKSLSVRPELVEGSEASTSSARTGVFDNLLIQGDNLEALKALLPFYRGQVKCIFIDPPYNTKSAFEHYDDNLEHAQWLSLMLPRLQLLRELLREDGSIWVTIDDNEGHYLKVLMDEVFGRGNFLCDIAWEKRFSPPPDTKDFGYVHDHALLYRKSSAFSRNLLPITEDQSGRYKNPDNDPRGSWQSMDYTCRYTAKERPNLYYPITQPITGEEIWPKKTRVWAMSKEVTEKNIRENRIWWGTKNVIPRLKNFLTEIQQGMMPMSLWKHTLAGHTQEAAKEMIALFGEEKFSTPKPERLIHTVLHIATNPGDLVLDSFLGSGTTAAVAHKMGRRWIGIEMGEHAATHCLPRLQKVLNGEQGGISKAVNWTGGGAFRFLRLGEAVFGDRGRINPAVRFATLAAFIWQQDTHTALDLAASRPGTPHIGTHYQVNSYPGNEYAGYSQIKPLKQGETGDLAFQTPAPELPEPAPEVAQIPKGTAYYLLYNGILGDKRPASGNVLTREVLAALLELHRQVLADAPAGAELDLVVYGEACRLGEERLKQAKVTFRHIPYDVRAQ